MKTGVDIVLALSACPSSCPYFVSVLSLNIYWLDFNETLLKYSILRVDVHIFCMCRSDHSTQELCPLISYPLCMKSKIHFHAISQQLLTRFQWNFVPRMAIILLLFNWSKLHYEKTEFDLDLWLLRSNYWILLKMVITYYILLDLNHTWTKHKTDMLNNLCTNDCN